MQVLEADPLAPSRARGLVRTTLAEWGLGTSIDTTALLVSELVTNAVKYGRGPITVSLEHVGPVLRIGVADTELDRLPQPRLAAASDTSGRGMFLVEAMARNWGWAVDETSKTVWAELLVS